MSPGSLVVEIHPPHGHTGTFTFGIDELPPGWLHRLLSALRWALQRVTHPTR